MPETIKIIGGGLAGCEAALQLAKRGHQVKLYEMRGASNGQMETPAHKTDDLAELVCSNSFKGLGMTSAHGLFKAELRNLNSELMDAAEKARVPAGESLTVDREVFSKEIESRIESNPNIELIREEVTEIHNDEWTLVAAGPLCSSALSDHLFEKIGSKKLRFFDAIAPVVDADSIDMEYAFKKNRWEKGETEDFINCPLDQDTYEKFVDALLEAEGVEPKPFEKNELFEGCLPVEELARRGRETLRYGPMRPVGLMNMETGEKPYAVIQLRTENTQATLYNMVGFQTRLRWGTQKEIFTMVPALKNAEFVRLGAMHRNTFIDSPSILNPFLNLPGSKTFFAGQITGAEGYTEAVGTGLYTALQIDAQIRTGEFLPFPQGSCLEALTTHLTERPDNAETFQPMNFNFGLLPRPHKLHKRQKKEFLGKQAQKVMENFPPET